MGTLSLDSIILFHEHSRAAAYCDPLLGTSSWLILAS